MFFCSMFVMYEIIWCIFTLVSLNQLNGSDVYHFYLTSHPNMIEYLEKIQPEDHPASRHQPLDVYCKNLKESRIFKAVDPDAPNFKLLGTDWGSLLNFADPSLVMQNNSRAEQLNIDLKKEIAKLGKDGNRQYNSQLHCFNIAEYEYFLVFNWGDNISDYDKLLLIRHVESKESAILGLLQRHMGGVSRIRERVNKELGGILDVLFLWGVGGMKLYEMNQHTEEETFCSLDKHHVLNYCSCSLNLFWDWIEGNSYKGFMGLPNPSLFNSVEVGNCKSIDGKVNVPTEVQTTVDGNLLPCTVIHEGGLITQFHLAPAGGVFLESKADDGNKYMLHANLHQIFVKNDGLLNKVHEFTGKI